MLEDLRRPHAFAAERVGFLHTSSVTLKTGIVLVLAKEYVPVDDTDYERDPSVGAKISSTAIRKAMQGIYDRKGGCFHVHLHDHGGPTWPSGTDQKWLPPVAEGFSHISGQQANGILILSQDSCYATVKIRGLNAFMIPSCVSVVGNPMRFVYSNREKEHGPPLNDRQSFLGKDSAFVFENAKVCIIGYGGGGSHIGQQLAHIGVKHVTIYDGDFIEETNMNRLIGAWFTDVKKKMFKAEIAKRTIKKILPNAVIRTVKARWQEKPEYLQESDIVIAGVDSLADRDQLEAECRRYLIPLVDMGMDIFELEDHSFAMAGQVILSLPGAFCLHCFGYLTPENLSAEAKKYGDAGHRPQVVWPNGILASTAVGIVMNLLTGWTNRKAPSVYLAYDGNRGLLTEHPRAKYAPKTCIHYPLNQAGLPVYRKL
jgi:hypothetical protein